MVNLRDHLKRVWCATSHIHRESKSWRTMQIEVRLDGEVERGEVTNYDEVQDYLANGSYPEGATKAVKGVIRKRAKSSNSWMISFVTRTF